MFWLGINTNKTKRRLYDLALRSDPKACTYRVRQATNTVGSTDTFQDYSLQRLTYRPATQDELILAQATLNDLFVVWTITQFDLDQVGAPAPQVSYILVIEGRSWVVERATEVDLFQSWECLCRLAR